MPCLGYPCNNSLLECFTKGVCLFEKMFQGFLKVYFESVCEVWFEKQASVFDLQVDKYLRAIYPKVLKDFCYVLTLLTILFHHCIWWTILCQDVNGTGTGHRLDHDCNGAKYLWAIFSFKGLDHFFRQLSKASSRDYDHLVLFCFASWQVTKSYLP